MLNIFPRAENAPIEQIIGYQRPSAHPPENQTCREQCGAVQHPGFVPLACRPKWFMNDTMSSYEKSMFDPEHYLEIRNGILNMYLGGAGNIALGMCKHLGRLPTVIKIFDFLEDNKLINYEVELKADIIGIRNEVLTNPAHSIEKNFNEGAHSQGGGVSPPLRGPAEARSAGGSASGPHHKRGDRRVKTRYVTREMLQHSKCACGQTAHLFTSDMFFICDGCLAARDYPSAYAPRNFHRITPGLLQSLWTKREEYELLRNIELHGDDWEKVSETLNKSSDQCIFHFLKMSLFDECEIFPSMCFSTVPNQISTFIAYVAYMIHPSISAEMAKTAIKYLDRENIMEILVSVAVHKAKEVLVLEREKHARLAKVGVEALIRKIGLKIDALAEMCNEVGTVRAELEVEREKLMDELIRDKNK